MSFLADNWRAENESDDISTTEQRTAIAIALAEDRYDRLGLADLGVCREDFVAGALILDKAGSTREGSMLVNVSAITGAATREANFDPKGCPAEGLLAESAKEAARGNEPAHRGVTRGLVENWVRNYSQSAALRSEFINAENYAHYMNGAAVQEGLRRYDGKISDVVRQLGA